MRAAPHQITDPTLGLCNGPVHEEGLSVDACKGARVDHFGEPGASTGGSGRNLRPNWAQGEENYTLKGQEFPQIYESYVKSETLDSCRFEAKMRQNAPNPISISIFSGVTPRPRHWGLYPRGGKGRAGRGMKGRGKFASLPLGIDAPVVNREWSQKSGNLRPRL